MAAFIWELFRWTTAFSLHYLAFTKRYGAIKNPTCIITNAQDEIIKLKHPESVTFCKERKKHLQKTNKMKLQDCFFQFVFYWSVFCSQFSVKDHETLLVTTRSWPQYLLKHHQMHLCRNAPVTESLLFKQLEPLSASDIFWRVNWPLAWAFLEKRGAHPLFRLFSVLSRGCEKKCAGVTRKQHTLLSLHGIQMWGMVTKETSHYHLQILFEHLIILWYGSTTDYYF